jgi:ethanolaminephosphotransferase
VYLGGYQVSHGFHVLISKLIEDLIAQSLHLVLTAFLVTQSRINNIPVFLLFFLALECIRGLGLSPDELTLTSIIFQYTSFFALGGSNSISSVDLSNAYNGVSDYNVGAVGMLTFFGNWAGPVWWSMTTLLVLFEGTDSTTTTSIFIKHLCYMSLVTAINVVSVMVACTMLRTHLFIWTVFSPKYLFTIAWTLGQHVIVNLFMGSFFYALCS